MITPDKTIVSGHQRVRACKELGIEEVMCDVHTYDDDDQILQDLLETNIRQRGDIGGSYKQIGRRSDELKRIYGIKNGGAGYYGNQYEEDLPNNSSGPKTRKQIAKMQGMSVDTMENYIMLSKAIPEIQDLVDTGIVTKTTALAIMRELPEDEQADPAAQTKNVLDW
ncbi:MAG: hypothetical protein LUF35_03200 [Lachnospiraceae bacterium]|nr:hypothetical protein [Lachnospiraceae bacterium]